MLSDLELQLIGIPVEIESYNINMEEFEIKIKEYIYKKGLIDATTATFTSYNMKNDGILNIKMKLDDFKKTILNITINLNENKYQITM